MKCKVPVLGLSCLQRIRYSNELAFSGLPSGSSLFTKISHQEFQVYKGLKDVSSLMIANIFIGSFCFVQFLCCPHRVWEFCHHCFCDIVHYVLSSWPITSLRVRGLLSFLIVFLLVCVSESQISLLLKNYFSYFSTKTFVVGTKISIWLSWFLCVLLCFQVLCVPHFSFLKHF